MLGKYALAATVAFVVVIVGMLIYPTVHLNWAGVSTTGWQDITKAGAIVASYFMLFWIAYLVYAHIKK